MNKQATILVIVGISGDLAKRKLLPSIADLFAAGQLPEDFRIIGTTRQAINNEDILHHLSDTTSEAARSFIDSYLTMLTIDMSSSDEYEKLRSCIDSIEHEFGAKAQRLYYLSVPPAVSSPIIEHLGTSGLAALPDTKLLIEKPFGVDLASARALIEHINTHFAENMVYRIDHYLAKEMAQNLLVFRERNQLFSRTWNSDSIAKIEVIASEEIDIEGRANFYEQTGALRDLVQSHLLQLTALTLMDSHEIADDWSDVPKKRLTVLESLRIDDAAPLVRAQYDGYKREVGNESSVTETFVSLGVRSNLEKWKDVPIQITTGKALDKKLTEIKVTYRGNNESDHLIFRLQPHESIELCILTKKPGFTREVERALLGFDYPIDQVLPDAYEHVFLDAIEGRHSLFTTSAEVVASWQILEGIQAKWTENSNILTYPKGSSAHSVIS